MYIRYAYQYLSSFTSVYFFQINSKFKFELEKRFGSKGSKNLENRF